MAIVLPGKSETLRVAIKIDSALNCSPEDYAKYTETLDESLLGISPGDEPTWFIMRKVLPFALSKKVQNEQAGMKDGEVQINISFIGEEVRCALVDIINPASVPVEQHILHSKEKDGGTSFALMEQLVSADVVNDLYRAREAVTKKKTEGMKKKIIAFIELQNATPERRKTFQCSTCPERIKSLRRCREDRHDFTSEDAALFPIYIEKGGQLYGFCPGKSTWDSSVAGLYQALVITAETGIMLEDGPMMDQPDWWIDLLSWFLPFYNDQKFWSRAKAILGSDNKTVNAVKGNRRG